MDYPTLTSDDLKDIRALASSIAYSFKADEIRDSVVLMHDIICGKEEDLTPVRMDPAKPFGLEVDELKG